MKTAKARILIVGGNGFVGSALARSLATDYEVFSTYQHDYTPEKNITYLNLTRLGDKDSCKAMVVKLEPDFIFYAAGSNDLMYCEQDANVRATQLSHSVGASNFLSAAESVKARFIYLSCDSIFSGVDGNFSETDSAIPAFQLGKAKLGAENFIRSRSLNYLIIRSAPLMGRGTLDHPSWLDKIREAALTGKKTKLPSKSIHNPVHISFLIELIQKAMKSDLKNKTLHVGGLSKVSTFECAQIFVNQLKLDPALIEPSDSSSNAMAADYSLNFSQTLKMVDVEPLLLEQSLERTIGLQHN